MLLLGQSAAARCSRATRSLRTATRLAALLASLVAPMAGFAAPATPTAAGAELRTRTGCGVADTASPLALPEIIERALCTQPSTRLAAAAVHAARAAHEQAQAAQRPSVSASMNLQHAGSTLRGPTDTQGAELRLSWMLFDSGKRTAIIEAASYETLAAYLDADEDAQAVMLEAARRYLAVIAAEGLRQAAQVSLDAALAAESAARARLQVGETVRLDVLQAESARARAQLVLVRAQREHRLAQLALSQYIGAALEGPIEVAHAPLAGENGPQTLSQALQQLERHPMLRAVAARVQSARASETAAAAQGGPSLALSASLAAQGEVRSASTRTGTIGLQLTIPLYDAGLVQAQRAAAHAQTQAARAREGATRQALELGLAQQYTQLQAAYAELAGAEALVAASALAEEHASGRYRAGVGLLLEWLDAQARLAQARTERIAAQNNVLFSRWALARMLGALSLDSFSAHQTPMHDKEHR